MHKKIILIFVFVLFFTFFKVSFGNVVINEVQIESESSKDDEFIELYNNSGEEIDLTNWSLYKKTSGGTESSLVAKSRFANKKIGAYGTLFLARENNYLGTRTVDVFWPSSYSVAFNNSLILYKDFENKIVEHSVSWGEVSSFKYTNSNAEVEENNNDNLENEQEVVVLNEQETIKTISEKLQINTSKLGFAGIPISLEAIVLNQEYKNIYGKFLWNFGDGNFKEVKSIDNNKFSYKYNYPGKYNIYVEYYKNSSDINPTLFTEINLEIISPTIIISNTGEQDNFFIELTNKTNYDINLQNFILSGQYNNFIFPKNTFLKKNNKIILSPEATNFNLNDKNFLELRDTGNKIIFSNKILTTQVIKKKVSSPTNSQNQNIIIEENNFSERGGDYTSENFDLEALALDSNSKQNLFKDSYFLLTLFLIIFAIFIVLLIRKNSQKEDLDEFEILDE